ncbi:MAG: sulfatase-like hydrolase/transferase [Bryobacteraceae bacterium]|nr:sulfatase-like hydrolase/transferase [Bryobacteraceae bacterium]
MNRRQILKTLGAAPAFLSHAQTTEKPPNVVFFLLDKWRRDAAGCYGSSVKTPNIDNLAASGVRFENCFTPQALCGPARASILTGVHPHMHGLRRNVYPTNAGKTNSNYQDSIPDPFRDPRFRLWENFVYYLSNAGYATAHIGKWHLGPGNPGFFDYFKSFNSVLRHWIGEPHKSRYRPDVHTDLGIRFIDQHASEPFFLYQSYYAPHEPLDPPKQWIEQYANSEHPGYYGSVANLDWNIGRVVEALKRNNLLDNTLIVITTEHGRSWTPRPGTAEGMCTAYEESARIPMILRYPKTLPTGRVWRSGVTLCDLAPTILEAAGVEAVVGGIVDAVAGSPFQGRSLIGQIREGNDDWRRPVVIENIPQTAISGSLYEERAIRTERYKMILRRFDNRPENRAGEIYDLLDDAQETKNIWGRQPQLMERLAEQLVGWGRDYRDPLSVELGEWTLKQMRG